MEELDGNVDAVAVFLLFRLKLKLPNKFSRTMSSHQPVKFLYCTNISILQMSIFILFNNKLSPAQISNVMWSAPLISTASAV